MKNKYFLLYGLVHFEALFWLIGLGFKDTLGATWSSVLCSMGLILAVAALVIDLTHKEPELRD